MDQKLSDLVDKVDQEARKFATFNDYLESSENPSEGKEAETWQKPANDAVDTSSPSTSEKVDETVESSNPSSAATATEPTNEVDPRKLALADPNYIANGLKTEPVHPVAPEVLVTPDPKEEWLPESPVILETLKLTGPVDWQGQSLRSVETIQTQIKPENEPVEWAEVYINGRIIAAKNLMGDPDAIVERMNLINRALIEYTERAKRTLHGMRSVLDEVLKEEKSEKRHKHLSALDPDYRERLNQRAKSRLKVERAPKPPKTGIGKATALKFLEVGMSKNKVLEALGKMKQIDPETVEYVKNWSAK